jgi:hypothetical protein
MLPFVAYFALSFLLTFFAVTVLLGYRSYRERKDPFGAHWNTRKASLKAALLDQKWAFMGLVRGIKDFIVIAACKAGRTLALALSAVLFIAILVPCAGAALSGLIAGPLAHVVSVLARAFKDACAYSGEVTSKVFDRGLDPLDRAVRGW